MKGDKNNPAFLELGLYDTLVSRGDLPDLLTKSYRYGDRVKLGGMNVNSVQFIYKTDGSESPRAIGTGFIIEYSLNEKNRPVGPLGGHKYLVTCRHVVEKAIDDNSQLHLRLLGWTGAHMLVTSDPAEYDKIHKYYLDNNWVFHDDDHVDLAVIELKDQFIDRQLNGHIYDSNSQWMFRSAGKYNENDDAVSFDSTDNWAKYFATDESLARLNVGTDVTYQGVFIMYYGASYDEPITRFGKVAMMPSQRIINKAKESIRKYDLLLECEAYPANSGAPVFAKTSSERPVVIGVLNAAFPSASEHMDASLIDGKDFYLISQMGISAVTKISYVREIIEGKAMQKVRQEHQKQWEKEVIKKLLNRS